MARPFQRQPSMRRPAQRGLVAAARTLHTAPRPPQQQQHLRVQLPNPMQMPAQPLAPNRRCPPRQCQWYPRSTCSRQSAAEAAVPAAAGPPPSRHRQLEWDSRLTQTPWYPAHLHRQRAMRLLARHSRHLQTATAISSRAQSSRAAVQRQYSTACVQRQLMTSCHGRHRRRPSPVLP